jgi:hypothetical protein
MPTDVDLACSLRTWVAAMNGKVQMTGTMRFTVSMALLLVGVLMAVHRGGFLTEVKIGLVDSPEVKFGVGYVFH